MASRIKYTRRDAISGAPADSNLEKDLEQELKVLKRHKIRKFGVLYRHNSIGKRLSKESLVTDVTCKRRSNVQVTAPGKEALTITNFFYFAPINVKPHYIG